jgi:hypothetical protein
MREKEEELLLSILAQYEHDPLVREILDQHKECSLNKTAEINALENSMFENMVDGALKALVVISAATFDWKLLTITKLLESWISDRREEKRKKQQDLTLGVNYNITHPSGVQVSPSPYGGGSYY